MPQQKATPQQMQQGLTNLTPQFQVSTNIPRLDNNAVDLEEKYQEFLEPKTQTGDLYVKTQQEMKHLQVNVETLKSSPQQVKGDSRL